MNTRTAKSAMKWGLAVAGLFLGVALVPFLPFLAGEAWGTVWFRLTVPVSFAAERLLGVASGTPLLIVAISVFCAALWGTVAFLGCRVIQTIRRRSST